MTDPVQYENLKRRFIFFPFFQLLQVGDFLSKVRSTLKSQYHCNIQIRYVEVLTCQVQGVPF